MTRMRPCAPVARQKQLGMGGIQNFYKQHLNTKKCDENKKKYQRKQALVWQQEAAQALFAPHPPKTPSTVVAKCTCGVRVTAEEIRVQTDVIRCKKPGCETEWVSEMCLKHDYPLILPWQYHLNCVRLEIIVAGWTCNSCEPNNQVYKCKKVRKHAE